MSSRHIYWILCFMAVIVFVGCSKNLTKIKYNNDVFTEDLFNNIYEIDYVDDDTTHIITDQEAISKVYSELASLNLSPNNDETQKYGQMILRIITSDQTYDLGIRSEEISIGKQKYYVDKDICSTLRNLLIK